jgi:hypothetical protein
MTAAVTLALTSLTAGSGVANADAWRCDGLICTTAVYDVGVENGYGAYMYTVPAGALVEIGCYAGADHDIYYQARRANWAWGWIRGHGLATGRDPNPLVSSCH